MQDAHKFAKAWIDAWNSHDLDVILSHYADDIEITTPINKITLGAGDGSLKGKEAVGAYWKKALEKMLDLYFELYGVTEGVNSVGLYYKSVLNKKAVDVMFFNLEGKVNKMIVLYTDSI